MEIISIEKIFDEIKMEHLYHITIECLDKEVFNLCMGNIKLKQGGTKK